MQLFYLFCDTLIDGPMPLQMQHSLELIRDYPHFYFVEVLVRVFNVKLDWLELGSQFILNLT